MEAVLGYFVFENLGDGCLVSKYGSWHSYHPAPECAEQKGKVTEGFEGVYISTWIEGVDEPGEEVTLVIRRKAKAVGIFVLEWSGGAAFYGEGMMYGKLLIGAYWDEGIRKGTLPLK